METEVSHSSIISSQELSDGLSKNSESSCSFINNLHNEFLNIKEKDYHQAQQIIKKKERLSMTAQDACNQLDTLLNFYQGQKKKRFKSIQRHSLEAFE